MLRKLLPLRLAILLSLVASACTPQAPDDGGKGGTGGKASGGSGGKASGGSGGGESGGSGGSGTGGSGSGSGGSGGSTDGGAGDGGGGDAVSASDCTASNQDSLFCKPTGPMPKTLKASGLFPSAPDFSVGKRAKSLIEFKPSPELWSDGMGKQRFLLLPAGKKVDNSDRARWAFPIGTVFIKTFFDDMGGKTRPIETRFIRRIGDILAGDPTEYDYYVYKWNADGTDADLVIDDKGVDGDEKKALPVMISINRMVDGKPLMINNGQPFAHDLPSREMCGNCHTESGMQGQTFIGFDEIRLNSKLTPTAAKTQLEELNALSIFTTALPSDPATITDPDPVLERVKRAVFGNCAHCHMGGSVFDMRPSVFVENTVGKETEAQSVKPPAGWLRVVAGQPGYQRGLPADGPRRTPDANRE